MKRLRQAALSFTLGCTLGFSSSVACAQVADPTSTGDSRQQLRERIDRLAGTLESAQAQVDSLRRELELLRYDLGGAGKIDTPADAPSTERERQRAAGDLESLREEHEVLAAEVKQHEQAKVESESKFPLRIEGLVLFNTFVNQGAVNGIDLPIVAQSRLNGASHGTVGASVRQTWLGLEVQGPIFGAVHTFASVGLDFFGTMSGDITSAPSGGVRLRTARIGAETGSNLVEARFDEPLISPLSPTSFATVAVPALSWTGNLWTWAPELRWLHRGHLGTGRTFDVELGLRDPYPAGMQDYYGERLPSPAEQSRRPAFEARFSYGSAAPETPRQSTYGETSDGWRLGGGGYYAKQNYGQGMIVNTWATTLDWLIPVRRRLVVSGEAYRGTGLGGLGGGAYRDVVQLFYPRTGSTRTLGLDAAGGWVQVKLKATTRLHLNTAFGQDSASASELRLLELYSAPNELAYYARNRAFIGNLIYQPWNSIILSPEFRRVITWPIDGSANVANIFTLSVGYRF